MPDGTVIRWLCIIAVVVGCNKAATEQREPPRPPSDAIVVDASTDAPPADAAMPDAERAARIAALERLHDRFATLKRNRSPVEAPLALTTAYVRFELAYGHARLNNTARSMELVQLATAALASYRPEPVHDALVALYEARLANATAGRPHEQPIAVRLPIDRVTRYKVDRLREVSRVLAPVDTVDAIGGFAFKTLDARGGGFDDLPSDPVDRARELLAWIAASSSEPADKRGVFLRGCVEVAFSLPAAQAGTVVEHALVKAEADDVRDPGLFATALLAQSHFRLDLPVDPIVQRLIELVPQAEPESRDRALAIATRALVRSRRQEPLRALAKLDVALHAKVATGSSDAVDAIGTAEQGLAHGMHLTRRIQRIVTILDAHSHAPHDQALAAADRLTQQLELMTDSFGTNSHYTLSVLAVIDALVLCIVGDS